MKKGNGFYNPKGLSPAERAKLDSVIAGVAESAAGQADAEAALVELAEMIAAQDDALVELAEMIGE